MARALNFRRNGANLSAGAFLPAVLHSRSAFCVCERESVLEGAERDECCNVGPRARQGLLHKAEPHHNAASLSLSLSLSPSLCLSALFSPGQLSENY